MFGKKRKEIIKQFCVKGLRRFFIVIYRYNLSAFVELPSLSFTTAQSIIREIGILTNFFNLRKKKKKNMYYLQLNKYS